MQKDTDFFFSVDNKLADKNMSIEAQAKQVDLVKRNEAGNNSWHQ